MGGKPKKKAKPASKANAGGGKAAQEEEVKPYRKLYVKIPTGMEMTEAKLTELFKACGDVTSVDLVTTSTQVFGFVEFVTVPEAALGIEKMNGHEGMLVKFAKPQLLVAPVVAPVVAAPAISLAVEESEEEECSEAPAKPNALDRDCWDAAARRYPDPVASLRALVQKAHRAAVTADWIVYTVAEVEDEWETLFVGTVQLKVPAGNTSYSGKPQGNKKEANKSAAEAALRDPELHRRMPALPPLVKEQKVAKLAESDSEGSEVASAVEVDEGEEREPKARTALSTKKQKQLEKAEVRAKKLAMRRAAKAAKEAAAENGEEEPEEESGDEEDSTAESDSSTSEDSENSGESEDDSSDDELQAKIAEKKAALKAALADKRAALRQKGRPAALAKEADAASSAAQKQAKKLARQEIKINHEGQETKIQANFGQTKFIKP